MGNCKLSIIIPYYDPNENVRPLLARLLENLYQQQKYDHPETEIILVSDGSDIEWIDWTIRPRMTICAFTNNSGVSRARNMGLGMATGNIISFIDADDNIEPDYMNTIYGTMKDGYDYALFPFIAEESGAYCRNRDELFGNWAVWSWCFKRSIIGDERFNEGMNVGEDIEWLERVVNEHQKGARPDKAIYRYNWDGNPDSLRKRFNRGEITKERKSDTNHES